MWVFIAIVIVALVVGYAAAPKAENTTPPSLGDAKAPLANEGSEIPVLFGTKEISSPNVVWFGDQRTIPIRKKGGKK